MLMHQKLGVSVYCFGALGILCDLGYLVYYSDIGNKTQVKTPVTPYS